MTLSLTWSCCPSALRPAVAPRVIVEAGDPASPSAADAPNKAIVASGEKPSATAKGMYIGASIGTEAKESPNPIVINSPTNSIIAAPSN